MTSSPTLPDSIVWVVILLLGVGTYMFRVSFFVLLGRISDVPDGVQRVLRFVPPAVLSALVLPAIVAPGDQVSLTVSNLRLLAAIVAGVIAWKTEDIFATIVAGMGALYLLSWSVG